MIQKNSHKNQCVRQRQTFSEGGIIYPCVRRVNSLGGNISDPFSLLYYNNRNF